MDFNGALSSIMGNKVDKYVPWKLTYEFEINCDFTRKVPSLVNLLAFILFNDSSAMKNHIYWTYNEIWEVGRVLTKKQ